MGRYSGGKKIDGKSTKETVIVEKTVEKTVEKSVDANAIAEAVAAALAGKLGNISMSGVSDKDTFDSKSTMKALADSMTVQRGDSESNFEDLGNVKETKRDKKKVDDAIDFLKGVDDETN